MTKVTDIKKQPTTRNYISNKETETNTLQNLINTINVKSKLIKLIVISDVAKHNLETQSDKKMRS